MKQWEDISKRFKRKQCLGSYVLKTRHDIELFGPKPIEQPVELWCQTIIKQMNTNIRKLTPVYCSKRTEENNPKFEEDGS